MDSLPPVYEMQRVVVDITKAKYITTMSNRKSYMVSKRYVWLHPNGDVYESNNPDSPETICKEKGK